MSDIQNPGPDMSGAGPVEYRPAEAAAPTDRVGLARIRHEARLLAIPGVTFVGAGEGTVLVGVLDAGVGAALPRELDGVPITVTVTGRVDALGGRGASPRTR